MRKALDLAQSAIDPRPNPYVGALLVKNRRIISSGFHEKTGSPHAEIHCLDRAKNKIKNATLYVTLEPCTHFGYTSPCVNKIIESGIKHVVVGIKDANPKNRGRGIKLMRQRGIRVEAGFLENELKEINAAFIKYITKKIPYEIIFLFGAGFSIAKAFSNTGLANEISQMLLSLTSLSPFILLIIVALIITFTTEVTSNTALISIALPIIYALGDHANIDTNLILMVATICASYAFMLPIATPPNAIAMSSKVLSVKDMARYGFFFNLIAIVLTSTIAYIYW